MVHTDSYVAQATRALRESNNDLDGAFQVNQRGATNLINRIATRFEESLLPQCIARGLQHSRQPWNGCVEFTSLVSIATTSGFSVLVAVTVFRRLSRIDRKCFFLSFFIFYRYFHPRHPPPPPFPHPTVLTREANRASKPTRNISAHMKYQALRNIADVIMFPKCVLVLPCAQHLCRTHFVSWTQKMFLKISCVCTARSNVALFCHGRATSQDIMLPPQCARA